MEKDQLLRQLLGEDYDQLNADALKERLGKNTPDDTQVYTPINNDLYKDVVNNKANDYYNSRTDALQTALLKDRNPNISKQELISKLAKKSGIKDEPRLVEHPDMQNAYGAYAPDTNEMIINNRYPRDVQMSTIAHEMKHAANAKSGAIPILDAINAGTSKHGNDITKPLRSQVEGISPDEDPGETEQAIRDGNFGKISDKFNRGHFFGNDQVEDIADQTYNPVGFEKLKARLKGL